MDVLSSASAAIFGYGGINHARWGTIVTAKAGPKNPSPGTLGIAHAVLRRGLRRSPRLTSCLQEEC